MTNDSFKKWACIWNREFSKEEKMGGKKKSQSICHPWQLEKFKSKQHWNFILPQSEWQRSTRQPTTNAGGDIRKREPSFTVGETVNWPRHWKSAWRILKKPKINLSYDPAISLLSICPKDWELYSTYTCSAMLIAALVTMGRKWNQPKCPSIG